MQIVFDMAYDQSVAPDGVAAGTASIGKLFVGPNGLLNVLETQLGYTGKETHQAIRIQQYMESMEQLYGQGEGTFFSGSFSADPWSSAKQMLAWRDELVLAGWHGDSSSDFTPRLNTLAAIEAVLPDQMKKGTGDRLGMVLQALSKTPELSISSIDVIDQIDVLPALLQQLMHALIKCHVTVHGIQSQIIQSDGNLGTVKQAMLAGAARKSVNTGDDSLILLNAEDEWSAANAIASWLKADEPANGNVLLIQGQGSDVLDAALQRVGLPVQGINRRSPWRAALQVLPLALANVWKPLNVHALLEFLSLPVSPVPGFAARLLRKAIQREPGIGGERWLKAEKKIAKSRRSWLIKDGLTDEMAETKAEAFVKEINSHLTGLRFDPTEGITPSALRNVCEWVKRGLKSPELEKSIAQALAQVDRMIELSEHHNQPISRAQIERMLDSVIAEGGQNPDAIAEASPWMRVTDPGGIANEVETIIWWDFTDPGQSGITFWSDKERRALAGIGVNLEKSSDIRQREARQGRNALRYAGKRLILVAPTRLNGGVVQPHPIWDEIRHFSTAKNEADPDTVRQHFVVNSNSLNSGENCSFAGRSLTLQKETIAKLPEAETSIQIDSGCIANPKDLSFSQMSTLMGCPAKWVMHYYAGLTSMDSLSLPTGNTMIGSLCHKVVEQLYLHPETWTTEKVRTRTSELFDELVPQMAAELLEPGRELERKRYRHSTCDAVDALIRAIDAAGLHVVNTEGRVDGKQLDGVPFSGYIDLLLEDEEGKTFVIDLKWSGTSKYKREEIEKGEAMQLASYAWLLRKAGEPWAAGAYFMLAQGEMLTADNSFNAQKTIESPLTVEQVWTKGSKTWLQLFKQLKHGEIEVPGLIDEKELPVQREECDLMYIKPPCHFCEFGKLCGKTRAES